MWDGEQADAFVVAQRVRAHPEMGCRSADLPCGGLVITDQVMQRLDVDATGWVHREPQRVSECLVFHADDARGLSALKLNP